MAKSIRDRVLDYAMKCPEGLTGRCCELLKLSGMRLAALEGGLKLSDARVAVLGDGVTAEAVEMLNEAIRYHNKLLEEAIRYENIWPHRCLTGDAEEPSSESCPTRPRAHQPSISVAHPKTTHNLTLADKLAYLRLLLDEMDRGLHGSDHDAIEDRYMLRLRIEEMERLAEKERD